jgi:hypothetical protein
MTQRATARARPALGPLEFRSPRPARWETVEQRRRRLRDELLLAREDPSSWTIAAALADRFERGVATGLVDGAGDQELDGARARQQRYADEIRFGRWVLSPAWRAEVSMRVAMQG